MHHILTHDISNSQSSLFSHAVGNFGIIGGGGGRGVVSCRGGRVACSARGGDVGVVGPTMGPMGTSSTEGVCPMIGG